MNRREAAGIGRATARVVLADREVAERALRDGARLVHPALARDRGAAGIAERVSVLAGYEPRTAQALAAALAKFPLKKDVQPDDVLDALVAYVTARAGRARL